jgi:hypothetical protein
MNTGLTVKMNDRILAHLFDEDGQSLVGAKETEIDALLEHSATKIADTVPKIFTYWQSKQIRLN